MGVLKYKMPTVVIRFGLYHQQVDPYVYLTLDGILNLSSAPNPYLDFWIKKADGGNRRY